MQQLANYPTNKVLQQGISCTGDIFFYKMPNLSPQPPTRERNIAPKEASRQLAWLCWTLNGTKQVEAKLEAKTRNANWRWASTPRCDIWIFRNRDGNFSVLWWYFVKQGFCFRDRFNSGSIMVGNSLQCWVGHWNALQKVNRQIWNDFQLDLHYKRIETLYPTTILILFLKTN